MPLRITDCASSVKAVADVAVQKFRAACPEPVTVSKKALSFNSIMIRCLVPESVDIKVSNFVRVPASNGRVAYLCLAERTDKGNRITAPKVKAKDEPKPESEIKDSKSGDHPLLKELEAKHTVRIEPSVVRELWPRVETALVALNALLENAKGSAVIVIENVRADILEVTVDVTYKDRSLLDNPPAGWRTESPFLKTTVAGAQISTWRSRGLNISKERGFDANDPLVALGKEFWQEFQAKTGIIDAEGYLFKYNDGRRLKIIINKPVASPIELEKKLGSDWQAQGRGTVYRNVTKASNLKGQLIVSPMMHPDWEPLGTLKTKFGEFKEASGIAACAGTVDLNGTDLTLTIELGCSVGQGWVEDLMGKGWFSLSEHKVVYSTTTLTQKPATDVNYEDHADDMETITENFFDGKIVLIPEHEKAAKRDLSVRAGMRVVRDAAAAIGVGSTEEHGVVHFPERVAPFSLLTHLGWTYLPRQELLTLPNGCPLLVDGNRVQVYGSEIHVLKLNDPKVIMESQDEGESTFFFPGWDKARAHIWLTQDLDFVTPPFSDSYEFHTKIVDFDLSVIVTCREANHSGILLCFNSTLKDSDV